MTDSMPDPTDPAAIALAARVKRLMLLTMGATFIALALVFSIIGYRVFHAEGSAPPGAPEIAALVPLGAKVVATAIGEGRLAVTMETAGAQEVLLFDLKTLRLIGRVQLTPRR